MKTRCLIFALFLLVTASVESCKKDEEPELPRVQTGEMTDINDKAATCSGSITDEGNAKILSKGFVWDLQLNPTLEKNSGFKDCGGSSGGFTSLVENLLPNTLYHIRAFATNSAGTAYGNEITFTTQVILPEVSTLPLTNVTAFSVSSGGNVTKEGSSPVLSRGVCYSTTSNPLVSGLHTSDGSGPGEFSSFIENLDPEVTYHLRAYASNSYGTTYGEEITFTTLYFQYLRITGISNIKATSAVVNSSYNDPSVGPFAVRGICWSTSPGPTILNAHTSDQNHTVNISSSLNGLTPLTKYYIKAYANTPNGVIYSEESTFTTVNYILPSLYTLSPTGITPHSVNSGGNISNEGEIGIISARGVCWSNNTNPSLADNHTSDGSGTGVFGSGITGLMPLTTYYLRAYATNDAGTAYGDQKTFTTYDYAIVTTAEVTSITNTTAVAGGEVTYNGGTYNVEAGICYNTSPMPTIAGPHKTCTWNPGPFSTELINLQQNTTYYVRAFVTNNAGTTYGEVVSFSTLNAVGATVTTAPVTSITNHSAISGGDVTSEGGGNVTQKGLCWSYLSNPTLSNSWSNDGSGAGPFTSYITGLYSDNKYYVRAYAINEAGVSYGPIRAFYTSENEFVEYIYDDNSFETSASFSPGGQGWIGNKFEVTDQGDIKQVKLFFHEYNNSGTEALTIDFYNSSHGYIGSSPAFQPVAGSWITVDIDDIPFSNTFYAMVHWDNTTIQTNYLTLDTNGQHRGFAYQKDIYNVWQQVIANGSLSVFLLRVTAAIESDGKKVITEYPAVKAVNDSRSSNHPEVIILK